MERLSAAKNSGFGRIRLCRPEQDVFLLAKRKLDHAFPRKVRRCQGHPLVGDSRIIDTKTATLDLAPRFAVRSDETSRYKGSKDTKHPSFEIAAGYRTSRQIDRDRAFL